MKIQTLSMLAVLVFASGLHVHGQAAAKGGKSATDAWSTATAQDDGSSDSDADTGSTKKPKKGGSAPSSGATSSNPLKSKSASDDWTSQTDAAGTSGSGSGADASATIRRRKSGGSSSNEVAAPATGGDNPTESTTKPRPTNGHGGEKPTESGAYTPPTNNQVSGDKPTESKTISSSTTSQVGGDNPTESTTKPRPTNGHGGEKPNESGAYAPPTNNQVSGDKPTESKTISAHTPSAAIVKTQDSSSPSVMLYCRKAGKDHQAACDANDVSAANQGILTGRRQHSPLATVDSVSLTSDGGLTCKQTNGGACTDEQINAIQSLSNSNVSFSIVKSRDMSTPGMMQSATDATLVCRKAGGGGAACTAEDVAEMNSGMMSGKRQHGTLSLVKSVSLASPDGSLRCVQTTGADCTKDQLDELKSFPFQKIILTYSEQASSSLPPSSTGQSNPTELRESPTLQSTAPPIKKATTCADGSCASSSSPATPATPAATPTSLSATSGAGAGKVSVSDISVMKPIKGMLVCRKAGGGAACTAEDVAEMNSGMTSGKRQHGTLSMVQSISLASADGSVRCVQTSGADCTQDQLDELKSFPFQKIILTYSEQASSSLPPSSTGQSNPTELRESPTLQSTAPPIKKATTCADGSCASSSSPANSATPAATPTSLSATSGAGAGKVSVSDFSVMKRTDAASPQTTPSSAPSGFDAASKDAAK